MAARLFEPVDGASLVMWRVLLGLFVALGAARYVAYGWVDLLYIRPIYHFTYLGFDWVQPWPGGWMYVHYVVVAALGLLLAAGWRTPVVAGVLFVAFTWIELLDKTAYLNHYYLVSLLLLLAVFLPLDGGRVPRWAVWTVRAQLGLVYFFAGVAKLDADWLLRGEPMHIWLSTHGDLALIGPWLEQRGVAVAMSGAGCVFDLTVAGFLLWPRTRAVAYLVVLGFHAATGLLFNIGMFPLIMVGLTLVFFEPDWPRRAARRLGLGDGWLGDPGAAVPEPRAPGGRRVVLGVLAAWFAVQIALPLRHLAWPGDVRWTHEGWRLSWRVLLVETRGHFTYRVVDRDTGATWVLHPERFLDARQQHLASSSPDMILQLAHDIAADFALRGHDVAVYAEAWASMNGTRSQRLIDPEADLAAAPRTPLAPYRFVRPRE